MHLVFCCVAGLWHPLLFAAVHASRYNNNYYIILFQLVKSEIPFLRRFRIPSFSTLPKWRAVVHSAWKYAYDGVNGA